MVAQQRYAVFNLAIGLATLLVFAALVPFLGIAKAQCAFALLAIIALAPFIFRRRPGQVTGDERDRAIFLRATQISFALFWLLLVATQMTTWYLHRTSPAIPIDIFTLLTWLWAVALLVCHSSVLLVLYRRS